MFQLFSRERGGASDSKNPDLYYYHTTIDPVKTSVTNGQKSCDAAAPKNLNFKDTDKVDR